MQYGNESSNAPCFLMRRGLPKPAGQAQAGRILHPTDGGVFRWHASFESGFTDLDAQHRRFVEQVDRLALLRLRGGNASDLDALIAFLTEYSTSHCDGEESLMYLAGISEEHIAAHCRAHQEFPRQVRLLIAAAGDDIRLALNSLLPCLVRWTVVHLLDADLRMAAEIHALLAGSAAEVARREAAAQANRGSGLLLEALNELYKDLDAACSLLAAGHDRESAASLA